MKKLILAISFATLATVGLSATSASAKGWGGGGWGGGWGHHHHFHGGWGYGGGYGYGFRPAYVPRCRLVPGYVGWVRVCR